MKFFIENKEVITIAKKAIEAKGVLGKASIMFKSDDVLIDEVCARLKKHEDDIVSVSKHADGIAITLNSDFVVDIYDLFGDMLVASIQTILTFKDRFKAIESKYNLAKSTSKISIKLDAEEGSQAISLDADGSYAIVNIGIRSLLDHRIYMVDINGHTVYDFIDNIWRRNSQIQATYDGSELTVDGLPAGQYEFTMIAKPAVYQKWCLDVSMTRPETNVFEYIENNCSYKSQFLTTSNMHTPATFASKGVTIGGDDYSSQGLPDYAFSRLMIYNDCVYAIPEESTGVILADITVDEQGNIDTTTIHTDIEWYWDNDEYAHDSALTGDRGFYTFDSEEQLKEFIITLNKFYS